MEYTLELEIGRPRSEVARLFGEAENMGTWQPGFVGIEPVSGEPGKAGSQTRLKYLHGKRDVELFETIEIDNLPEEFSGSGGSDPQRWKGSNQQSTSSKQAPTSKSNSHSARERRCELKVGI